jgi:hypothetical protein
MMRSLRRLQLVAVLSAILTLGGATLIAAPALATDGTDYSRFQIAPGVYPSYPPCLARQETEGGGCLGSLYFDCEGLFGSPAPCDDPEFWAYWEYA